MDSDESWPLTPGQRTSERVCATVCELYRVETRRSETLTPVALWWARSGALTGGTLHDGAAFGVDQMKLRAGSLYSPSVGPL